MGISRFGGCSPALCHRSRGRAAPDLNDPEGNPLSMSQLRVVGHDLRVVGYDLLEVSNDPLWENLHLCMHGKVTNLGRRAGPEPVQGSAEIVG